MKHEALDIDQGEKRPCFLSNICRNWKLGAPTISHHLKELVNAKLVKTDKEGKYMICSLNDRTLAHLRDILD
jgi:ArsR family transcriptional regulator, arsenate/arsenite/antimonite-responsive transcriptional repressor